jgi:translation elongation factor P/translation initiation factor 5A
MDREDDTGWQARIVVARCLRAQGRDADAAQFMNDHDIDEYDIDEYDMDDED